VVHVIENHGFLFLAVENSSSGAAVKPRHATALCGG